MMFSIVRFGGVPKIFTNTIKNNTYEITKLPPVEHHIPSTIDFIYAAIHHQSDLIHLNHPHPGWSRPMDCPMGFPWTPWEVSWEDPWPHAASSSAMIFRSRRTSSRSPPPRRWDVGGFPCFFLSKPWRCWMEKHGKIMENLRQAMDSKCFVTTISLESNLK